MQYQARLFIGQPWALYLFAWWLYHVHEYSHFGVAKRAVEHCEQTLMLLKTTRFCYHFKSSERCFSIPNITSNIDVLTTNCGLRSTCNQGWGSLVFELCRTEFRHLCAGSSLHVARDETVDIPTCSIDLIYITWYEGWVCNRTADKIQECLKIGRECLQLYLILSRWEAGDSDDAPGVMHSSMLQFVLWVPSGLTGLSSDNPGIWHHSIYQGL